MPTIPLMTLAAGDVSPADFYTGSIYSPSVAVPPGGYIYTIGDVLQGSLDADNWGGGDGSVPAHAMQMGTFARGWSTSLTRWETYYASQLSGDSNNNNRLLMTGLGMRVFIPFRCKAVWYGYQAWCLQDATIYDVDPGVYSEFFDIRFNVQGAIKQSMYAKLPHSRLYVGTPSSTPHGVAAAENRFKWVNKVGMALNVDAGHFSLRCEAWANIKEPDADKAKMRLPVGSIWVMAFPQRYIGPPI